MLISLQQLIKKHNLKFTGVIHAGSHWGEEVPDYYRAGIREMHLFEPCEEAFNILRRRCPKVKSYQFALGASECEIEMNVERKNNGQSNSLLKPVLHLEQYPDILFDEVQLVKMRTLDSFNITDCNFLNMDVQGYELEVLKGATETLKHIEYIYTEINRDEVYERCARIEQLDELLHDFDRVETDWSGGNWGDALYIRKKKIAIVPKEFQQNIKHKYPPDNDLIFEEWYSKNAQESEQQDRIYLPVFWTGYYVNNQYGKNKNSINNLQSFLDTLDKSKKYYTICQYDDGILNNLTGLDIKVFSMSGHGITIPLVSVPHKFTFDGSKKYLANFIGKRTHAIRDKVFRLKQNNYYISEKNHPLDQYCKIISQSMFTLCPRGYGKTSFRIQEALQYGSIPVYISDDFVLPENFNTYGITISDVDKIDEVLSAFKFGELTSRISELKNVYEQNFTYESVKKYILNHNKEC